MNPPISIITVAYNSESTISSSIESMINQSFQNFEYIIIDGASADNTNKIIEKYRHVLNDKLIHISEPDKGIYDAMNKGIKLAKGELIGILNSDDYYLENTLETVYNAFLKTDRRTVITGEMIFKSNAGEQLLRTDKKRFLRKIKHHKNGVRHPATFVPKTIYEKIGLFNLDLKIYADSEFIIRTHRNGEKFLFISKPLTVMCDGGISNSKGTMRKIVKDKTKILKIYCKNPIFRLFYITETIVILTIKEFLPRIVFFYRKVLNTK